MYESLKKKPKDKLKSQIRFAIKIIMKHFLSF